MVNNKSHFHVSTPYNNRCGDGYGEMDNDLCGQNMSPWDCVDNPELCKQSSGLSSSGGSSNSMNKYGYPAHFDLQDANKQITAKGWDNPEVTWEQVDCSKGDFGDWDKDCQCPKAESEPASEPESEPESEPSG